MVKRPRKDESADGTTAAATPELPRSVATTVHLAPEALEFLYARGARTERQRSPFNASRVLGRAMARLALMLQHSDPVTAGHMTEQERGAVIDLLQEPWELSRFHILHLDRYLGDLPQFGSVVSKAGLDAGKFLRTIEGLSIAEKVRILDEAELRWAPQRATARPE